MTNGLALGPPFLPLCLLPFAPPFSSEVEYSASWKERKERHVRKQATAAVAAAAAVPVAATGAATAVAAAARAVASSSSNSDSSGWRRGEGGRKACFVDCCSVARRRREGMR